MEVLTLTLKIFIPYPILDHHATLFCHFTMSVGHINQFGVDFITLISQIKAELMTTSPKLLPISNTPLPGGTHHLISL